MTSSKTIQTKKCKGCGSWLTNELDKVGYTPKPYQNVSLCQACFKLINYQTTPKHDINEYDYFQIHKDGFALNEKVSSSKFCTILVTDIYNLGIIPKLKNYKFSSKAILIINKADLINFYQKKLLEETWKIALKQISKSKFEIYFISVDENEGLNNLVRSFKQFHEVCFMGNSGVGKSSLINKLADKYNLESHNVVGSYLNTTKNVISQKFDRLKVLDTPGSIRNTGIFNYLDYRTIKILQISKWVNKVFQFSQNRIYLLENFCLVQIASLDQETKSRSSFVFHGPIELQVTHTKIEKFDLNKLGAFPNLKRYDKKDIKWTCHKYEIDDKTHFEVDDLGWIDINVSQKTSVKIYLPEDVTINKFNNWKK